MRSHTAIPWFFFLAIANCDGNSAKDQEVVREGWIERRAKLSNNASAGIFLRYDTQLPDQETVDTNSWAYWSDTEHSVDKCGNSTVESTGKSDADISACMNMRVIMDDQPGFFSIENWVKADGNGYGALVDANGCVFGVSVMQLDQTTRTGKEDVAVNPESSQTEVGSQDISDIVRDAIEYFGVGELVGAHGTMECSYNVSIAWEIFGTYERDPQ
ncbi:hypothetical protein F5B20DRAFT_451215 [Whalleya microplaca]|nr:hypothetical protein F5B20DRAFT_451215 [Whalleya microplaca]